MFGNDLAAFALDSEVLGALANSLGFRKSVAERRHQAWLFRGDLDGQALAALAATVVEHQATTTGCHTGAEAVGALTTKIVRLIRTLHSGSPWI